MSANFRIVAQSPALDELRFSAMQVDDLPEVLAIENDVYPYPWTRGNFLDSLYSGYHCVVLRDSAGALVGYFLLMLAVDEAHLLNISVRRDLHGHGFGRYQLDRVVATALEFGMASVLLEVRPSNTRAYDIYRQYGFAEIGRRKGYYPAGGTSASGGSAREDAIVMRYEL